jgi:hypothetical protein
MYSKLIISERKSSDPHPGITSLIVKNIPFKLTALLPKTQANFVSFYGFFLLSSSQKRFSANSYI